MAFTTLVGEVVTVTRSASRSLPVDGASPLARSKGLSNSAWASHRTG